ncbi:MAG: RNA methyltransferase [Cellvibrionales bacterium]|nr:RNA methyltransferase [Cellvibrionales bacterium]
MLDKIRIILVNTTHPGNIGAAARAMKNMGLGRLYLVAPKKYPDEEAVWRAGHALDVLDNVVVTETVDEAIGDSGLVIGTSARERKIPWPLMTPREVALRAKEEPSKQDIAILFGREDRGLTNEELQKCHIHLNIPTADEYSSLNLAQAVQVVSYELRLAAFGEALPSEKETQNDKRDWDVPLASTEAMELFYAHLEQVLIDIDFHDPKTPRQTMTRLRRLFTRVRMDDMELAMLRGILKKIDKTVGGK